MTQFRFRLEPLLKARQHVERERQRAVAELERRRRDLEDALRGKQTQIDESKRNTAGRLVGHLEMADLRGHAVSTMGLMREAHRVLIELAGVHRQLEGSRARLTEAAKQRQAIEGLRDRRWTAWRDGQRRAEAAILDELAITAAAREGNS